MMIRTMVLVAVLVSLLSGEAWACQQYRDVMQDRNGNAVSGVTITVLINGTVTTATLYGDPACSGTVSNPRTSGSDGYFSFWAKDGEYDLTFVKTGFTFSNLSHLALYDPLGENIKTVAYYPTTDLCAAAIGAIDTIGATPTTLVINKPVTCSISKTIVPTLNLKFSGAGTVTISSGQTLTVSSGVEIPVGYLGGASPWFGPGTVTFSGRAGPNPRGLATSIAQPTYGATITIDATIANLFIVTVTNASAFTFANPLPSLNGGGALLYGFNQRILIMVRNLSGAPIAVPTFGTDYKLGAAFVSPANGTGRFIEFVNLGTGTWVELDRSPVDVAF